jgi:uncharacterized protein
VLRELPVGLVGLRATLKWTYARLVSSLKGEDIRMHKIRITAGDIVATATLNDTQTAEAIWNALPLEARANTWGDEIYFAIPVRMDEEEDAKEIVAMGELGYWPPGHAFCIFFGRTPMSRGNEIRPASAVNVLGKVEGDAKIFKRAPEGAQVILEKINE